VEIYPTCPYLRRRDVFNLGANQVAVALVVGVLLAGGAWVAYRLIRRK
jgi:hypothetical protein